MAQRPAFGALKKAKPPVPTTTEGVDLAALPAAAPRRIQTSVRLDPEVWAALSDLATRKRLETGRRVTAHDLIVDGVHHILAVNGVKLPE